MKLTTLIVLLVSTFIHQSNGTCFTSGNVCQTANDCCSNLNCVSASSTMGFVSKCQSCGTEFAPCLVDNECCNFDNSRSNETVYKCSLMKTQCVPVKVKEVSCAAGNACKVGEYCVKTQQGNYLCKTLEDIVNGGLLKYQPAIVVNQTTDGKVEITKTFILSPVLNSTNSSNEATVREGTLNENKDGVMIHETDMTINGQMTVDSMNKLNVEETPFAKLIRMLQPVIVDPFYKAQLEKLRNSNSNQTTTNPLQKQLMSEENNVAHEEKSVDKLHELLSHDMNANLLKSVMNSDSNQLTNSLLAEANQITNSKKPAEEAAIEADTNKKLNEMIQRLQSQLISDKTSITKLKSVLNEKTQEAFSTSTTTAAPSTTTESLWSSLFAWL